MKKYTIPEMKLSRFDRENIVTQSGGAQQTAMQQAQTAADGVTGSQKTFTVTF